MEAGDDSNGRPAPAAVAEAVAAPPLAELVAGEGPRGRCVHADAVRALEERERERQARTRRFTELVAADPRLRATAIRTVGSKGWDGFAFVLVT